MTEITLLHKHLLHFLMYIKLKMDVKLGILILLNMAPPSKLVLAPSTIFRGNTVHVNYYTTQFMRTGYNGMGKGNSIDIKERVAYGSAGII